MSRPNADLEIRIKRAYESPSAGHGPLTLVYSAHDEAHNQAVVLRETLLH
ncbi:MAG: hypothetical protein ACREUG_11095 [Steroidobacteraceae bacterium]